MDWTKKSNYHMTSEEGYVISAGRGGDGGGWLYTAWSPVWSGWADYRAWMKSGSGVIPGGLGVKVTYRMGEALPAKRECLAVVDDLESAQTICQKHWEGEQDVESAAG